MRLTEIKEFLDLLKVLPSYESRYTLMTLAHIGQACGRIAVYDKELIDRIIMRYRFSSRILNQWRLHVTINSRRQMWSSLSPETKFKLRF